MMRILWIQEEGLAIMVSVDDVFRSCNTALSINELALNLSSSRRHLLNKTFLIDGRHHYFEGAYHDVEDEGRWDEEPDSAREELDSRSWDDGVGEGRDYGVEYFGSPRDAGGRVGNDGMC